MSFLNSPGGFIKPLSATSRGGVQGGAVREIQSTEIVTNAMTLTAADMLGGVLLIDSAATSAVSTLTTPSAAQLVSAGLSVGDTLALHVQNNSSWAILFAAGDGITLVGNPSVYVGQGGGVARLSIHVRSATTADITVKHVAIGASRSTTLSASSTLTPADSGMTFLLPGTVTPHVTTLPTPAPGLFFGFLLGATATQDSVVTAGATRLTGVINVDDADIAVSSQTSITFDQTDGRAGDFLIVEGISATQYRVWGYASVASGFSVA